MHKSRDHSLTVRGIIHCHTDTSYDSKTSLADLCRTLRRDGFDFVALTEHAQGVSSGDYRRFVAKCQQESTGSFLVIPGLEVRSSDGVEIAGIGVAGIVPPGMPHDVTRDIRAMGGYAIWVHPLKRRRTLDRLLDCDAVEVLNGKVDGTLAPSLQLLRVVRRSRKRGARFHAVCGLDLHDLQTPRSVWLECQVPVLTRDAILSALREGRYVSRTPNWTLSSAGNVGWLQSCSMVLLKGAYFIWSRFLGVLPPRPRKLMSRCLQPLVKVLKEGR
jgi:hypothetical protein